MPVKLDLDIQSESSFLIWLEIFCYYKIGKLSFILDFEDSLAAFVTIILERLYSSKESL